MTEKKFHVYTWMEDELRRLIVSGLLPENKPIWSESVLMQKYGIGRNAVRAAVGHLEEEGLLKRVHGSGTFVVPQIQRKHPHSSRKKGKTILYLSFPPYSGKTFQLNTETYFQDMVFMLRQEGYDFRMAHVGTDGQLPEILRQGKVDGILFEGEVPKAFYEQNIRPYPCAGIDFINPEFLCSWIDSGKFTAGESAVKYLYKHGHRRIAFLTDESHTWSAKEFLKGYRSAMLELKLKIRPEWEICWMRQTTAGELNDESKFLPRDFLDYLKPVFASHEPPTAVICFDNWRAVSTMEALNQLGLTVPDDVSIIGNYTKEASPGNCKADFSCFYIRMKEFYLEGCRLLLEQIQSPSVIRDKIIRLIPVFYPGKTVKEIPVRKKPILNNN